MRMFQGKKRSDPNTDYILWMRKLLDPHTHFPKAIREDNRIFCGKAVDYAKIITPSEQWKEDYVSELSSKVKDRYPVAGSSELSFELDAEIGWISTVFPTPNDVRGKSCLDIGCGSTIGNSDDYFKNDRRYEPWHARTLSYLGADVTGIDLFNVDQLKEPYTHHVRNILDLNKLLTLPRGKFDYILSKGMFDAPSFYQGLLSGKHRMTEEVFANDWLPRFINTIDTLLKPTGKAVILLI